MLLERVSEAQRLAALDMREAQGSGRKRRGGKDEEGSEVADLLKRGKFRKKQKRGGSAKRRRR